MVNYVEHKKLLVISFIISIASMFQFGYLLTYINSAQTSFSNVVNQSNHKLHGVYLDDNSLNWTWSLIVNCLIIGFIVGTIITPFVVERLGRKWTILSSSVFDITGTALQVAATQHQIHYVLAIGRFVAGIGSGFSSGAVTLYLQEISPTNVRGLVSNFQELSMSLIKLFGLVIGLPSILGNSNCLPYLVGIGFLPALLKVLLYWCPDTPKFLYYKRHNVQLAEKAILFYHGNKENVSKVIEDIKKETEGTVSEQNGEKIEKQESSRFATVLELVKQPHLRKAVILGLVCFLGQETCGIVPLLSYSTKILQYFKVDENVTSVAAILLGVVNLITTTITLFTVDKFGRKKIFLVGLSIISALQLVLMACCIVAQFSSATWPGYLAAAMIVLITCIVGLGPGSVPWFITAELVPQHVRSAASSLTQVFNFLFMFFVTLTFLPLFDAIRGYSFLTLFTVPTVLCVIFLYFNLPETKNREIADIVLYLKKGTNKARETSDN